MTGGKDEYPAFEKTGCIALTAALDDRVTMDRVRDALHRIASVRDLDGKVSVSLPVMYPSGATVVVEIERNDDRYWVSDMGYGLVEAEMSGAQTFYGKIASRIADDFGVGFGGNAMFALWVASARLEAAITCVANASNRACSEAILQATEAKSRRQLRLTSASDAIAELTGGKDDRNP